MKSWNGSDTIHYIISIIVILGQQKETLIWILNEFNCMKYYSSLIFLLASGQNYYFLMFFGLFIVWNGNYFKKNSPFWVRTAWRVFFSQNLPFSIYCGTNLSRQRSNCVLLRTYAMQWTLKLSNPSNGNF